MMTVKEAIEILIRYDEATPIYMTTDVCDPISDREEIGSFGIVSGFNISTDGIYIFPSR